MLISVCIGTDMHQEIDLLLSSSIPSPLLSALPFVFLTNELHVLPPSTLQSGQLPPGIQVVKRYSTSQIDSLKAKFEEVKALGSATAEEWLKGLDGQGQEKKSDASRWERWEVQGGVARMRNLEVIEAANKLLRAASARIAVASSKNGNVSIYQPNVSLPRPPLLSHNPTPQMSMPVHNLIGEFRGTLLVLEHANFSSSQQMLALLDLRLQYQTGLHPIILDKLSFPNMKEQRKKWLK
jgi:hypothetical protein